MLRRSSSVRPTKAYTSAAASTLATTPSLPSQWVSMPLTVKKGRGATSAMMSAASKGSWLSWLTMPATPSGNQLLPVP